MQRTRLDQVVVGVALTLFGLAAFLVPEQAFADEGDDCLSACESVYGTEDYDSCFNSCCNESCAAKYTPTSPEYGACYNDCVAKKKAAPKCAGDECDTNDKLSCGITYATDPTCKDASPFGCLRKVDDCQDCACIPYMTYCKCKYPMKK